MIRMRMVRLVDFIGALAGLPRDVIGRVDVQVFPETELVCVMFVVRDCDLDVVRRAVGEAPVIARRDPCRSKRKSPDPDARSSTTSTWRSSQS